MINIDDYIKQAANMENTSDGGSPSYRFGNVVLIKYQNLVEYGHAREGAEEIALLANEKNAKGVRTPAHLGIKRVINGDVEICWVLQEIAKGKNFCAYTSNKDNRVQLSMQLRLANAPQSHYDKLVNDVCELFNLGLELKPKNMFYDESLEDGGFTIIDLLSVNGEPFNSNSLKDIVYLHRMLGATYNVTGINSYNQRASEREKCISKLLLCRIHQKVFIAMENSIPNFDRNRRWILRSLPNEVLEYFAQNGTYVGDLSLNEEEQARFKEIVNDIINSSLQKIENGTHEYWQIHANEIRIALEQMRMSDAWRYHKSNIRNINKFDGSFSAYDFRSMCDQDLNTILNQIFDEELDILAKNNTNEYVLKAKEERDKEQSRQAMIKQYYGDEPRELTKDQRKKIIENLTNSYSIKPIKLSLRKKNKK